jgi:hypothetical protein
MAVFQQLDQDENKNQVGSNAPQVGANPTPTPQQKGSGRFTNIQSYLNANKGAGQQLAQGVAGQVQKKIDPVKKQAESYNEQVRQGIQGAQNTLNQGQQQYGQLQQIGSNIKSNTGAEFYGQDKDLGINQFTQSPDYNQFQKIQAGQGVNEDVLNLQQQAFANQANKFNQVAKQQADLASSEGGRFNLLKQSYGGNVNPRYTQGQQRLDQLFLQKQGLGDLRQNLNQNVDTSRGLQAQTQETGQGVRSAQEGERSLIGNIDTQARANEADYLNMLESYVPEINKRREQEFSDLATRYGNMNSSRMSSGGMLDKQVVDKNGNPIAGKATPGQQGGGLSAADLKLLGVTSPAQTFNVFDKTTLEDVAQRGRQAQSFRDAANQSNVDAYNALSDIARLDKGNRKLTEAANLDQAVQSKQGAANLNERLKEALNTFNKFATEQNYNKNWSGGKKSYASTQANLMDLLSGGQVYANEKRGGAQAKVLSDQIYADAMKNLREQGFGKVLDTEGNISNYLPTELNKTYTNLGRDSGSQSSVPLGVLGSVLGRGALGEVGRALGGALGNRSATYSHRYGSDLSNVLQQIANAGVGQKEEE